LLRILRNNLDTLCLNKDHGGLRVRRLKEFNLALFGKWCWKMLVDTNSLWYKVLCAHCGQEGGDCV